jgi:hypothetical protein
MRKYSELVRKYPGLTFRHPTIRTALYVFLARKGYMPDDIRKILEQSFHNEFPAAEE